MISPQFKVFFWASEIHYVFARVGCYGAGTHAARSLSHWFQDTSQMDSSDIQLDRNRSMAILLRFKWGVLGHVYFQWFYQKNLQDKDVKANSLISVDIHQPHESIYIYILYIYLSLYLSYLKYIYKIYYKHRGWDVAQNDYCKFFSVQCVFFNHNPNVREHR